MATHGDDDAEGRAPTLRDAQEFRVVFEAVDEATKQRTEVVETASGLKYLRMTPDHDALLNLEHQFVYERQGDLLRFRTRGMNTLEVQQMIVGLWLRLPPGHRDECIAELIHLNTEEGSFPSALAKAVEDLDTVYGDTRPTRSPRRKRRLAPKPDPSRVARCPDCAVHPGELHVLGCDVERCYACGRQMLQCAGDTLDCCGERIDDGQRLRWTGEWPGLAECRAFGWYTLGPPWTPCAKDTPGAREDLNRLYSGEARWDRAAGRYVLDGSS